MIPAERLKIYDVEAEISDSEGLVNLQGPVIIPSLDEADEQRAGLIGLADLNLQRMLALGEGDFGAFSRVGAVIGRDFGGRRIAGDDFLTVQPGADRLSADDFEYITTYENSTYAKPHINYYKEILATIGAEASDCLMVGNDTRDDMVAESLGMKVFLATKCLINKENKDISVYPSGELNDLVEFIKTI